MEIFDKRKLSFVIVFLVLFAGVVVTNGCSKQRRPDGMPPIYPCTIVITQEGKPLADASVRLYSNEVMFYVSGTTDASGSAVIRTHGEFPGAPEATYKVVVSKEEKEYIESAAVTAAREKAKEKGEMFEEPSLPFNLYSYVEDQFTKSDTTPLEMTVTKGKNNHQSFEAGKAGRISLGKMTPE